MKCPACANAELERRENRAGPADFHCRSCSGCWLPFDDHLHWLESQPAGAPAACAGTEPPVTSSLPPSDVTQRVRLCPRCSKLLSRFRVSADHAVSIERCPACAGIWFDQGEREATLAIVPMSRIQHIFNDAHQHRIAAELRRRQHEERCRAIVGDEALARTREFKAWLEQHPRQDVLRAYLDERFDAR